MAIKEKIAREMFNDFVAARVESIDSNRSTDAEQNIGVSRYLDATVIIGLMIKNRDAVSAEGKLAFIEAATKSVNWSKSRLYQFMPVVEVFPKINDWLAILKTVSASTAIKLLQDSKIEKTASAYNRGDVLKYVAKFYKSPPQYVAKLRTAFDCALANDDADGFIKAFIGVDAVSEKSVFAALRAYHKPVAVEPVEPVEPVDTDTNGDADADADATSNVETTILEESAKLRERIEELEKLLAAANGDVEKANVALYKATHIKVNGDVYVIDAKLRKSIIAPAIRKNASDKGVEPLAVEAAKNAATVAVEPVDRDAAKLARAAAKAQRSRAAKKGIARKAAKSSK